MVIRSTILLTLNVNESLIKKTKWNQFKRVVEGQPNIFCSKVQSPIQPSKMSLAKSQISQELKLTLSRWTIEIRMEC